MSSPSSATECAPAPPSRRATGRSPTLGPITKLPLELITHTLNSLLRTCETALDRQLESQRWLRVNRAFHDGYLLSEAVHERAVATGAQASALTRVLESGTHTGSCVRRIWVGISDSKSDGDIASMVAACGGELERFEWLPGTSKKLVDGPIAQDLVLAWKGCSKLNTFTVGAEWREISAGEAQE